MELMISKSETKVLKKARRNPIAVPPCEDIEIVNSLYKQGFFNHCGNLLYINEKSKAALEFRHKANVRFILPFIVSIIAIIISIAALLKPPIVLYNSTIEVNQESVEQSPTSSPDDPS